MFEDLVPQNKRKATTTPPSTGGMFSDLIPEQGNSNVPAYVKATNPEATNNAWFKYNKDDSTLEKGAKTIGNIIPSAIGIGKGIFHAVTNPIETVKNVGDLVAGTAGVGAEKLIENTDIGQRFLEKANESRRQRGLPELRRNTDGTLEAEDTEEMTKAKGVGNYFKERYGGVENIKRSVVEDPAGIALDVSALFTGGSTLAPKVAKVSEVAGLTRTANVINKTGNVMGKIAEVTDPIRQTVRVAKPAVTRKLNDVSDLLSKTGTELKADALKEGLYGMNETIGSLKKKFEDTSYTYTKPDGTKVDINPIDTMVEYDLIPQPAKGGSLNVSGIKDRLPTLKKEINDKIDTVLKTDNKTISINDYARELENAIERLDKSQLEKTKLARKLDGELKDLAEAYPDGQVPLDEINKIRKEANAEFREDKVDFARVTGNATREIVYNATDDMVVKDLLNEQRKLINVEDYASKLAIHKVKGGRLGNYLWSIGGGIVGGATKLPMGIGELLGTFGGRAISETLQRRQLKSLPADVKAGLEKVVGKPLTVDVKGGMNNLFGQKSPKIQPDSITPKTINKTDSIDKSISQDIPMKTPRGTDFIVPSFQKGLSKEVPDVTYHGTSKTNADSILKNGWNTEKNTKGFAEAPDAFYTAKDFGKNSDHSAGTYGEVILEIKPKNKSTLKVLSPEGNYLSGGKSRGGTDGEFIREQLRKAGYDAIDEGGGEYIILNPEKFTITKINN